MRSSRSPNSAKSWRRFCARTASSPDRFHDTSITDGLVAGDQGNPEITGGGDNQRVEGILGESQLIGQQHLRGRQIQGLVGGVREQVSEELAQRSPEVDANRARQQRALP